MLKGMGLNATPEEVAELLAQLDLDNDGTVDYQEFKRVMAAKAEVRIVRLMHSMNDDSSPQARLVGSEAAFQLGASRVLSAPQRGC